VTKVAAPPSAKRDRRKLPPENPLIPHATMRQLFTTLMRWVQLPTRSRTRHATEAAVLPVLLASLQNGDAIAPHQTDAIDLFTGLATDRKSTCAASPVHLPTSVDAMQRALLAAGAAAVLDKQTPRHAAVLLLDAAEDTPEVWKAVALAGSAQLPLLAIILPAPSGTSVTSPSLKPPIQGVPLLPVDAADAVALYRVVQESLLRLRHGGGMVILRCLLLPDQSGDPLARMTEYLSVRGFPVARWTKPQMPRRAPCRS
jgi:hypothetical protein